MERNGPKNNLSQRDAGRRQARAESSVRARESSRSLGYTRAQKPSSEAQQEKRGAEKALTVRPPRLVRSLRTAANKENQGPFVSEPKKIAKSSEAAPKLRIPSLRQPSGVRKPSLQPTKAAKSSLGASRKASKIALSPAAPEGAADWSTAMETELQDLTGQFNQLKRDALRPALQEVSHSSLQNAASETTETLLPVAKSQFLQTGRNAVSTADRLKGLVQKTTAAEHELQTLQKPEEQILPSFLSGQLRENGLTMQAKILFDDPEFAELFNKGMKAQLQRTKDGATDKSRIAELAGLVKLLRRALKEMTNKSNQFVEAALHFEKTTCEQIEAIDLASKASAKRMEAELAGLKRDAAQAAAAHKQAIASWHSEVDRAEAETRQAKRELERLESERDRAREDARKAEEVRVVIEGTMKGVKKEAGQQLRDLQVDHGQARRALQEEQEAYRRKEAEYQELIASLHQSSEAALAKSTSLECTLGELRQELRRRGDELAAVSKAKTGLEKDCQRMAAGLAEHERLNQEISARSHSSESEAISLQQRCTELARDVAERDTALQELRESAADEAQQHASEHLQLQGMLQEALAVAAKERGQAQEMAALNNGLQEQIAEACRQEEEASLRLQQAAQQITQLQHQLDDYKGREVDALQAAHALGEQNQQLTSELEDLRQSLSHEQELRKTLSAEASVKAARLARLEGEFEAMQDAIGTGSLDQAEMLGRLVSRVASLEAAVAESQGVRRELHNQLVNLRGNIRVFCRLKPHPAPVLSCTSDGQGLRVEVGGREELFQFDRVFQASASQQDVFNEVSELIQSALDGFQVCLFSYGQTGAGKTHTMQGGRNADAQGIIPRAVAKILDEIERLKGEGWEYQLEASFVEVYNESLRDLLAEGRGRDVGKLPDTNVIRHHPAGGPSTVVGAIRATIASTEEAAALVKKAAASRAVEATAMNAVSSRSHSLFMLYICGHHPGSSTHIMGGLNLVDLAGSERLNRSQAEGQRQKEACSINKSLSALGDVFAALASRNPHVPHRNSKLTHLLQPCLGGDGKTLMFVNVNPEAESLQESLCSLRFAAKVNACQTAARGGAKRHVSLIGESLRGSMQGGPKRQTLPASNATAVKRKAMATTLPLKSGKAKLR